MIKNVLKRILRDKKINITTLTKKIGLSRSAIYNFMNKDTKTYRIKTMEAICRYLNMNISQIIYYEAPTQHSLIDYHKNTIWNCKYPRATVILNKYSTHLKNYSSYKLHTNVCDYRINFVINNTNVRMVLMAKMLIYKHKIFIGYKNKGDQPNFIAYFSNPYNLQQIAYQIIKDNNQYFKDFTKLETDLKKHFPKLPNYFKEHQSILNKMGINNAKFQYLNAIQNKLTVNKNDYYQVFMAPLSFIAGGYLSGLDSELGYTNSIYKDGGSHGYKNISISFDLHNHNLSNLHKDQITRTVYSTSKKATQNIFELNISAFKKLK